VPRSRIGVLIGSGGQGKKRIESLFNVSLEVNGRTGVVVIKPKGEPCDVGKAVLVVQAIGSGFSLERALPLMSEENTMLTIDLREYVGKARSDLERIKGRIIGEGGRARRLIEELTNTYVSVYEYTVSVIGAYDDAMAAMDAVRDLALGSLHRTVYEKLQRRRRMMKAERMSLGMFAESAYEE